MLVSRLLRSLLSFFAMGIVPDGAGGGEPAPAPAADPTPAPAAEPTAAPAPAPAPSPEPADPFASLRTQLEALGDKPADGTPAPAPSLPRDPSGRFATAAQKAAGVAAPAPAAAPAAQAPAAPAPAPKPGEIDLTPPEGMNPRSQERWAQLTERVKQAGQFETQAREATQALDSVRQLVTNAGLAPQEFSEMLETARLTKTNNPQEAQLALQRLDTIRANLAQRFGLDAPGVDPLAGHPDLKSDVDNMLMTKERALEIARLRAGNQVGEQLTQQQRELDQHRQTVTKAADGLSTFLQARANTPGAQQKFAYIQQHFANPQNLQAFVNTYQPHQWQAVLQTMWDLYTPQAPAPVAAPAAAPVPQPLRSSAMRPGAQVQTTPLTAMDAVRGAFATLGQG